jgi:hypothetical protein
MYRPLAGFAIALASTLWATPARAEVPLDQLKTEQIRARLRVVLHTKEAQDKVKGSGVAFSVTAEGVTYDYADGKPRLVWWYLAPAPLTGEQQVQVRAVLWPLLSIALIQIKVDGMSLVTAADEAELGKVFQIQYGQPEPPPVTLLPEPAGFPIPGYTGYGYGWYWYGWYPYWYGGYGYRSGWYGYGYDWYGYGYGYGCRPFAYLPPPGMWGYARYGGAGYPYGPAPVAGVTVVAANPSAGRVVPRAELLKDKTPADWPALYDTGYRHFWAGRYAQAVECCAAAVELKDDPRAWYYLALSLHAMGETEGAWETARYAAALVTLDPRCRAGVDEALSRVQGPVRDKLTQLQLEVRDEQTALRVVAARPKLIQKPGPAAGTGIATAR